jgi:hypothetical protein
MTGSDAAGTVACDEARHVMAAGDDHRAPARAWQEGPHLGRVCGVVEDDEHPAAGDKGPVERRSVFNVACEFRTRYAERYQKAPQSTIWSDGRLWGVAC